jgi:propionyl-CoA synthetase
VATYQQTYAASLDDPESFWGEQAANLVDWFVRPRTMLDRSGPHCYRWFGDGTLNTCFNALDRHVIRGRADQAALVYESPLTGPVQTLTYSRLLERVAAFAGVLRSCGVGRGDRVVIWMPTMPEAVIAMLAAARLGAVHAVLPGMSSVAALAGRVDDTRPKVVVTASCGADTSGPVAYKPLLDEALTLARHRVDVVIVKQRSQLSAELVTGRDIDFDAALRVGMRDPAPCVPVAGDDPLYVLHSGDPRDSPEGVVRDNGGHAVALTWAMKNVFAVSSGQVWWTAARLDGVVGHSCLVYAPLFAGATTVLYEGSSADAVGAGVLWRLVADHAVEGMLATHAVMRTVRNEDPDGKAARPSQLPTLRHLFLAGDRPDPHTYDWASRVLDVPVIDTWWQTASGSPVAANPRGLEPLPVQAGSASRPMPGFDLRILDERGNELPAGRAGSICLRLPLPPGAMSSLTGDSQQVGPAEPASHHGYYDTGCHGYRDEDDYVFVTGPIPLL